MAGYKAIIISNCHDVTSVQTPRTISSPFFLLYKYPDNKFFRLYFCPLVFGNIKVMCKLFIIPTSLVIRRTSTLSICVDVICWFFRLASYRLFFVNSFPAWRNINSEIISKNLYCTSRYLLLRSN